MAKKGNETQPNMSANAQMKIWSKEAVKEIMAGNFMSKEQYKNDPRYINMRKNNIEFGEAAKALKYFILCVYPSMNNVAIQNPKIRGRIGKQMIAAVKADNDANRGLGERIITNVGLKTALENFEINPKASFKNSIKGFSKITWNAVTNTVTWSFANLQPELMKYPLGTTHVGIEMSIVKLNITNYKNEDEPVIYKNDQLVEIQDYGTTFNGKTFEVIVTEPAVDDEVLVCFSKIYYTQLVNGTHYKLMVQNKNASRIDLII